MAPRTAVPNPIFILAAPRSYTSLISTMIGQNPMAYGVPELNLFVGEVLEDLWRRMVDMRQIQLHGLLRTIAHLFAGEQTIESIDMARRWVMRRLDRPTGEVYEELCRRVAPRRIVDKSPIYVADRHNLERIRATFPDAHYLHLVRHPLTQGRSIMAVANGIFAVMNDSVDYATDPPTVDPQILWHRTQTTILSFLDTVPTRRRLFMRGEDILENPERELAEICRWAGLAADEAAVAAMLHPERSPFACLGPVGAHLGNDMNFLTAPAFTRRELPPTKLDAELPWRPDGLGFRHDVVRLARDLGYG